VTTGGADVLTCLHVRNFAIIDEVGIELGPGMTVLTGETGAGKSLLVDALSLVLGERGGTGLARDPGKRIELAASFDVADAPAARDWLAAQSLDADGECLLRRVIGEDGRSRAFVNGNAVPLASLKELGELLLDIHGQHFHQSLVRRDVQRDLLDHHGGLAGERAAVAAAWSAWRALEERLRELREAAADRAARLDLLAFQVQELDALALGPGEYAECVAEREQFRHGAQLAGHVHGALGALSEGEPDNAQRLIAEAAHRLAAAATIDGSLERVRALVEEASIQVGEAVEALERYGDSLEADPARLEWLEDRLDAIRTIARKHRVEPEALPELQAELKRKLAELSDADATTTRLEQKAGAARAAFLAAAAALTDGRRKAAKRLAAQVTDAMRGLGMPQGVFEVALTPRPPEDAGPAGTDDIEYLISANAGQAPMPLARVASGGELSRMSLAIQVIASDGSAIPTMVFDEVDAGVGGGVAEMVGRRLKALAAARQVLCVTHLPQVASLADHHWRVAKLSDGKTTRTSVTLLSDAERVEEIARMLGGVKITKRTRDHAAEMLQNGRSVRRRA
jgi:DNA repair protein RecN (Recombination protein N)